MTNPEIDNQSNVSDVEVRQSSQMISSFDGIKLREEEGEVYVEGFIATTHPDRGPDGDCDGMIQTKEALQQMADAINSGKTNAGVGNPRAVGVGHDWIKQNNPDKKPVGMAVPGSAEVRPYEDADGNKDGHWGLWSKTHLNKTHPAFEETKYNVEHGYYPGFSIEWYDGETSKVSIGDKVYHVVKSVKDFIGYTFAEARKIANMASWGKVTYREVEASVSENVKMAEEEVTQESQPEQNVEVPEVKEEPKEVPQSEEAQEEKQPEEEKKEEPETREVSDIDVDKILNHPKFRESLDSVKVRSKVRVGDNEMEDIKIREIKDAGTDVAKLRTVLESSDMLDSLFADPQSYGQDLKTTFKIRCVGKGIEFKGGVKVRAILDSGSNTESTYGMAPVEFADAFQPGLIDTFNNQTTFFGFLRKVNHVGGKDVGWKIITNQDPNSNPTFYDFDDPTVQTTNSGKENINTPLVVARRAVRVADTMLRYTNANLGDLFMRELEVQMNKMMSDVNAALFAEQADGSDRPLGLEAVADSAGNGTIYGKSRTTANRLLPAAAGDTYNAVGGSLTEAVLRAGVTKLENAGVPLGQIAIVASPTSRDYLFNLLDGNRRFNTTEAAFGFNKQSVASYDGIPIVVDSDCNSDAIYIIDTMSDEIVIGMAPQIVSLAKTDASTKAYIEMHFAHVYKEPRKIHMLDTLSGP